MKKHIAQIIENNDPDLEGKVQIYIPYLMEGFKKNHYPWAKQDKEFASFIPEKNEFVWVWFEDELYLRNAYYQNKVTLKEYHDHNKTIGSMSGAYPDIKYLQLKNGVSIAVNSNQTEASIVAGGAEIYINPSGEIHIKGSSGSLEFSLLGEKTKAMVEKFLDKIIAHTHTTGVGPSGPPINSADFTAIKTTDVAAILSTKVKNS
jgi:hypothetical protein